MRGSQYYNILSCCSQAQRNITPREPLTPSSLALAINYSMRPVVPISLSRPVPFKALRRAARELSHSRASHSERRLFHFVPYLRRPSRPFRAAPALFASSAHLRKVFFAGAPDLLRVAFHISAPSFPPFPRSARAPHFRPATLREQRHHQPSSNPACSHLAPCFVISASTRSTNPTPAKPHAHIWQLLYGTRGEGIRPEVDCV